MMSEDTLDERIRREIFRRLQTEESSLPPSLVLSVEEWERFADHRIGVLISKLADLALEDEHIGRPTGPPEDLLSTVAACYTVLENTPEQNISGVDHQTAEEQDAALKKVWDLLSCHERAIQKKLKEEDDE